MGPVFPLGQAAEAVRALDTRKATGKVVLHMRPGRAVTCSEKNKEPCIVGGAGGSYHTDAAAGWELAVARDGHGPSPELHS